MIIVRCADDAAPPRPAPGLGPPPKEHVVTFDVHAKDAGPAGSQDHPGHLAGVGEDGLNAGKDVTGEWRKGTLG
jgi:hypothetical protein